MQTFGASERKRKDAVFPEGAGPLCLVLQFHFPALWGGGSHRGAQVQGTQGGGGAGGRQQVLGGPLKLPVELSVESGGEGPGGEEGLEGTGGWGGAL